jgi:hypothetical protein
MYYIGLVVHKKTISYCVKDASGQIHREGTIGATRNVWGLVHSLFVTTPVSVMGLLESYSSPKEWCAASGVASKVVAASNVQGLCFIIGCLVP